VTNSWNKFIAYQHRFNPLLITKNCNGNNRNNLCGNLSVKCKKTFQKKYCLMQYLSLTVIYDAYLRSIQGNVKDKLIMVIADCLEIWEPQPPGTLRACPGL